MELDQVLSYKAKIPTVNKIIGIVFLLSIFLKTSLHILKSVLNIYLIPSGIRQNVMDLILTIVIIVLIILYIPSIWMKVVIGIIGVIVISTFNFENALSHSSPEYYYETSPNHSNLLIIEENVMGLDGWSNIYLKLNPIFVKKVSLITTDDGRRPFHNKDYEFAWIDNDTVKLTYSYDVGGIMKTETIEIN